MLSLPPFISFFSGLSTIGEIDVLTAGASFKLEPISWNLFLQRVYWRLSYSDSNATIERLRNERLLTQTEFAAEQRMVMNMRTNCVTSA